MERIQELLTGRLTPEALEEVAALLPEFARGGGDLRQVGQLLEGAGSWIAGWDECFRLRTSEGMGYSARGVVEHTRADLWNTGQAHTGEVNTGEVSAGQVSAGQASAGQASAGQVNAWPAGLGRA